MIDAMFAAARKRLHHAIEYRASVFLRETAYLASHHRRCLGHRYSDRCYLKRKA